MISPRSDRRRAPRLAAVLTALLLAVAACGDDGGGGSATTTAPSGEEITEAGFHFGDASITPERHRSWTLTVTDGMAYLVVDSYGDVVGEDAAVVPAAMWADLQAGVAGLAEARSESDEEDCDGDGATSAEVWAREGEADRFQMSVSVCGSGNRGTAESWRAPFDPVLDLFDLEALTAPAE